MANVVRVMQVLIDARLESVFDYVSDLTRHPEWSGGELKIEEVAPGAVAVGKEYLSKGEVPMQKDRPNQLQVTEYEPPLKFGFSAQDPDFGTVHHVFTFTDTYGKVLVVRTTTFTLKPLFALAFRLFIYPFIGKPAMQRSMRRLKAKLE